jgi:hypothetical protein
VVFAFPLAMTQTFILVHLFAFLSCAWRLTSEVSGMDTTV